MKESLEVAIQQILTPKSTLDLLSSIAVAKKENRPFSMVFIGVTTKCFCNTGEWCREINKLVQSMLLVITKQI
jgi:hypothetical protein